MISIKKHFGGSTERRYIYLSGWMVAALRSEFGPLPDQSMHEKTSVPALIAEIYTFLRQADQRELGNLFRELDAAKKAGDKAKEQKAQHGHRRLPDPRRADHRRHRRRLRQCRGDLPARQEDDRGRRLRAADREPGLRREAVRPPGRQGHGPARGLHRQGARAALRLPRARRRGRHHRHPHRLARRRPDQADRRLQDPRRPRRPLQLLPRLRGGHGRKHQERRRHPRARRQARPPEAPALEPLPVHARHRRGPLRARLDHLAAERRRPALDRDREAAHRADRVHGGPHPRGRAQRQARLQQLALVQLDAELPPAGVRRHAEGRQGRLEVRSCRR